jgi:hypothetical protein
LGHPVPAQSSASLTVGPPRQSIPDQGGVSTFHMRKTRPGRVPPQIPGRRCSHDRSDAPGRRLPLRNGQPCTPAPQPIHPGLTLTRRNGGSLTFTRPAFPSPAALGWIKGPLRLLP